MQELPAGGLLFDKLMMDEHFTEYKAAKIITQILKALQFAHSKGIVHRDINSMAIHIDDPEGYLIKLGNFGNARILQEGKSYKEKLQHAFYSPPQVIRGEDYSKAIDVWGVGVLLYMMMSGTVPFDGKTEQVVKEGILNKEVEFPQKYFRPVSDEAKNFIASCLVKDEAGRITVEEALEHPWITNNSI